MPLRASLPRRPDAHGSIPMNKPISAKDVAAPKVTTGTLPGSRKVYSAPQGLDDLQVPLREIALSDGASALSSKAVGQKKTFRVCDTARPYSDPEIAIDVRRVLVPRREHWKDQRGNVE